MNKYVKIIISICVCLLVAFLASLATQSSVKTWFVTIEKPFFNPPSWLFAPVWTILYIMMGIAVGLIWSSDFKDKKVIKSAMVIFGIQLGLNALWSILFFGLRNPLLAFIEILLLWLFIFETIKAFRPIDGLASKLLYPYLAWVSFATILNASICWLNK